MEKMLHSSLSRGRLAGFSLLHGLAVSVFPWIASFCLHHLGCDAYRGIPLLVGLYLGTALLFDILLSARCFGIHFRLRLLICVIIGIPLGVVIGLALEQVTVHAIGYRWHETYVGLRQRFSVVVYLALQIIVVGYMTYNLCREKIQKAELRIGDAS
jgi:hypothetical protein